MKKFIASLVVPIIIYGAAFAQTETIMHDGIQRSYIVHLPPNFIASDTLPLVFSIHGLTMTAQSQSDLSQFNPIADRERFVVVYPQGLPNAQGLNAWNTFSSPYHSGVDDFGFLSALIDTLYMKYHINLRRVYSCGMSNGGFMSYRLACELSDRIAAIASVTGCLTDSMEYYCHPDRPLPVLHFHGTSDPLVNYNGGLTGIKSVEASLQYWIQNNNCPTTADEDSIPDTNTSDGTTITRFHWGPCDAQTQVIHYRVNGGGHTWPGNTQNFIIGGNYNLDVMASEIIWDFFKQYSLPEAVSAVELSAEHSSVLVYPNPADDMLTINAGNNRVNKIRLTDISGKEILRLEAASGIHTIDLHSLPAGTYFLACDSKVYKILHP